MISEQMTKTLGRVLGVSPTVLVRETWDRAPWLEAALGFQKGERLSHGSDGCDVFRGLLICHDAKFPYLGGVTEGLADRLILLSSTKAPDPLSQYVIALHERGHFLAGHFKVNDPESEAQADSYAFGVLSRVFDAETVKEVWKAAMTGVLYKFQDLPSLAVKLLESGDSKFAIVGLQLTEWLRARSPEKKAAPSSKTERKTEGKTTTIRLRDSFGGRIVREISTVEAYVAKDTGEVLGLVGAGREA